MKRKAVSMMVTALLTGCLSAGAQGLGVKNNLLYDLSLTPNANVEWRLSPHWSTDIGFGLHPWTLPGDHKLRHWLLQPELRRWFCQPMNGRFVAFHLMGGEFNAGNVHLPFGIAPTLRDRRYEGWYVGAGIGYGYQWALSRHFSIEAELAVGYDYLKYRKYPCANCGTKLGEGHYHYIGPTKIALNLIYNINKGVARTAGLTGEASATTTDSRREAEATAAIAAMTPGDAAPSAVQAEEAVAVLSGQASVARASVANVGGRMVLSMAVTLDSLRLQHGQTVVLRPVLRSADGSQVARFRPLLINSRDQHVMHLRGLHNANYPDALEIERRNGRQQTVNYLADVAHDDWMRSYTLEIDEDLCGCGDLVADNTTPLLSHDPQPTLVPEVSVPLETADYKKEKQLQGQAYIDFRVNKTYLDPQYRRNPQELQKIIATIDKVRNQPDVELRTISIHGYASPEGSFENNVRLAEGRAATLAEYIRRLYSMSADVISSTSTPEDWDGLRRYVENCPVGDGTDGTMTADERDGILAIIDGPLDPDPRNDAIRQRYPQRYQQLLADVYPGLRHSDYVVTYLIRAYTLEESRQVYRDHPEDLSLAELQALATDAGPGSTESNAILYRAAELMPQNPRAQLLAAQAALHSGDYDRTEQLLRGVPGDEPQANYLLGAVRKMQKRYAEAEALMRKAFAAGITEAKAQLEEIGLLK